MLFYGPVQYSLSGADLQTSPLDVVRTFWFAWNPLQNLGIEQSSARGELFPSGAFFSLFSLLHVPAHIAAKAWMSGSLLLAALSMYWLCGVVADAVPILSVGRARFVAALLYAANPFVVQQLSENTFPTSYTLLPLQLGLLSRGLSRGGDLRYAALLGLTALGVSRNQPVNLINYAILGVLAVLFLAQAGERLKRLRFCSASALAMLLASLWYWLPFGLGLLADPTSWAGAISQEDFRLYNPSSSFVETFRLLGYWGLYSGYKGVPYHTFGPIYAHNAAVILATLLVPAGALMAFVLARGHLTSQAGRLWMAFLAVLLAGGVFMAVGAYPLTQAGPTNGLYVWLYQHVPLFNAFRDSYKLVSVVALAYAPLMGITVGTLTRKVLRRGWVSVLPAVISATAVLTASFPMWTGDVFDRQYQFAVPGYWKEAQAWFNEQPGEFRIFSLPDQFLNVYTWGRPDFALAVPWIDKAVIFNPPVSQLGSPGGLTLIRLAYSGPDGSKQTGTRRSERSINEGFGTTLRLLGARYALQRNDVDFSFYDVPSPAAERAYLARQPDLHYARSFGQLDVYQVDDPVPMVWIPRRTVVVAGDASAIVDIMHTDYVQGRTALLFSGDQSDQQLQRALAHSAAIVVPFVLSPEGQDVPPAGEQSRELRLGGEAVPHAFAASFRGGNDSSLAGQVVTPRTARYQVQLIVSPEQPSEAGGHGASIGIDGSPVELTAAGSEGTGSATYRGSATLDPGLHSVRVALDGPGADRSVALELSPPDDRPPDGNPPQVIERTIDPTHREVTIEGAPGGSALIFSQSYNPYWRASIVEADNSTSISDRFVANGYANGWWIDAPGSYQVRIEYTLQRWFVASTVVSGGAVAVFLACLAAAAVAGRKRRTAEEP